MDHVSISLLIRSEFYIIIPLFANRLYRRRFKMKCETPLSTKEKTTPILVG